MDFVPCLGDGQMSAGPRSWKLEYVLTVRRGWGGGREAAAEVAVVVGWYAGWRKVAVH